MSDTPSPQTTRAVCDDSGLELTPRVIEVATKWLVWKHRMTYAQAGDLLANHPRGPTRQKQRQEAIDVADFVGHL